MTVVELLELRKRSLEMKAQERLDVVVKEMIEEDPEFASRIKADSAYSQILGALWEVQDLADVMAGGEVEGWDLSVSSGGHQTAE